MPGPFIFVAANKVRDGRLDGEKQRVPGWIEFIHSNEPRLIAFHEYLSEDGTEVEYVQVHLDTDSFENHMRVVERSGRSTHRPWKAPRTSGSTAPPARRSWKC
jgi:hypothetical protein